MCAPKNASAGFSGNPAAALRSNVYTDSFGNGASECGTSGGYESNHARWSVMGRIIAAPSRPGNS